MDDYSRECLAVKVGVSLKSEDVVEVLEEVIRQQGTPRGLHADNGTESTSVLMDRWAYWNGVTLDFSRSRQECLSMSNGDETPLKGL